MNPKTEAEMREDVVQAALTWWAGKRPLTWTEVAHLKFPEANLCSQDEFVLARAIRTLVDKVGGTKSDYEKSVEAAKGGSR